MTEKKYRECKYNTSKTSSFIGYCNLPKYHTDGFHALVKCKGCPCEDFELK